MTNPKNPDTGMTDQEELTAYDQEKLDLLKKSYALLQNIKTFVVRGGLAGVIVFVTFAVVMSMLFSNLTDNVHQNTQNIDKFGTIVKETRDDLRAALADAKANADPTFTARVNEGLAKIDKLCAQTNCEDK